MPKLAKLTNNEVPTGFTHIAVITAAEIVALGTGEQFTIGSVPPGGVVDACAVFEKVNFTGTSTDVTLDVGITGADPDDFINALDIDGLTKAAYNTGDVLINTAAGYYVNNTASAVPILAEFNGTLTSAGAATGEWVIAYTIRDAGQFA
jgi:L-serine deaminase